MGSRQWLRHIICGFSWEQSVRSGDARSFLIIICVYNTHGSPAALIYHPSFFFFFSHPISQILDIPVDRTSGLCDHGVFKSLGAILGLWPWARTVSRCVQNPDSSPPDGWRRRYVRLASDRHYHFWSPGIPSLVYAHIRRRYVMSPFFNRQPLSFLTNFDCPDDILCGLALVRPICLHPPSTKQLS
jgi:hypothetical protein